MAAYLLFNTLTTFRGSSGELLAGGEIRFFQTNTTTPQDVYGNRALSVNNGNTVALDASGRLTHECWADTTASYYVELYDADGVKQGEVSHIEVPGGQGQVIPVPNSGEYLTGDGTNFLVDDLSERLIPDPSGHSNEQLGTDGTTVFWEAKPEAPTLPVTISDGSFVFGATGSDFAQILTGTSSVSGGGGKEVEKAITFPAAFKSGTTPKVNVTVTGSAPTGGSVYPKVDLSSINATGFTVKFSTRTGGTSADNYTNSDMSGTVNFNWTAIGIVTEPA
jgi:hypothetical protein